MSMFKRTRREIPELNTSSLPDLIFTVLFFFMIVTHMRKVTLKVKYQVPQGTELTRLTKKTAVSYIYIGKPVTGTVQGNTVIQLNDKYATTTDIIDYIAENFGLQIGLLTAERLKKEIGSLYSNDGLSTVVNGRDIKTGTPRAVSIKAADIFEPTKIYYDKVCELVMAVLVKLPPEVSAEIRHKGIYFSGEASMVYGLEQYYADKFQIQVNVSENADMSVAFGGGIAMGDQAVLNKISIKTK